MNPSLLSMIALLAGPPGPLDAVPRQTTFAGYLEENGAGKNHSGLPAQLNIIGADGGVQWTKSLNVSTYKGRFAIEVGDNPPLPAALLNGPRAEVELSVGSPLVTLPRQRILSAPYVQRAGDVIVDDRTFAVGPAGQFPGLPEAWAWLKTRAVRGSVTLQLANGTYILPSGGLSLEHPDGARIKIIGNLSAPNMVAFTATTDGFIIENGSNLAQLAGLRLVGSGTTGATGIRVGEGARVSLGPVVITGFEVGVKVYERANVTHTGLQITGNGMSSGAGLMVSDGSLATGTGATISNAQLGVAVEGGGWAQLDGPQISSVRDGVNVTQGGYAELTGAAHITSAQTGLYAFGQSTIVAPPGIIFTMVTMPRSPVLNTIDNGNSWVTE